MNPAALAQIENGELLVSAKESSYFQAEATWSIDEDFIMDPLEELPDEKLDFVSSSPLPSTSDTKLYKRPYSRVGLGQKFDMSVPRQTLHDARNFLSESINRQTLYTDSGHLPRSIQDFHIPPRHKK